MRIGILYICTGKYNQFFSGFYESSEKYFLRNQAQKHYFVFTDDMQLSNAGNVTLIKKECKGFPFDSLFRFEMFFEKKKELQNFDYLFFFNSNTLFLQPVNEEILPKEQDNFLVGARWPGKRKPFNHPMFFPYERRKISSAYIEPFKKSHIYFMGGINGGRAKEYIEMIETLAENIQSDLKKGIVAKVHDESHINKYFREHNCKTLTNEYCWPEEWACDFEPKIIFRDKVKVDAYFNKGRDHSFKGKVFKAIKVIQHAIQWYI